jgi:hypothetical protein
MAYFHNETSVLYLPLIFRSHVLCKGWSPLPAALWPLPLRLSYRHLPPYGMVLAQWISWEGKGIKGSYAQRSSTLEHRL